MDVMPQSASEMDDPDGIVARALRWQALRPEQLATLSENYKRRDRWVNLAFPLLFVVLWYVCFLIINGAAQWYHGRLGETIFLDSDDFFLWIPCAAWLASLGVSSLFLRLLAVILGPLECHVYRFYLAHRTNAQRPSDMYALSVLVGRFLFLPSFLGVLLLIDSYTAVTQDEFIDNSLWSIGRESRHSYDRVLGVYEVQGFQGRFGPIWEVQHFIDFDDGERWKSPRGRGGPRLESQRAMVRFVAERSGLEVEQVKFQEDLPPQP
jgi:hypothetical protein